MSSYFVMVGPRDNPLYEVDLGPQAASGSAGKDEHRHLNQFIVHAALDCVDEAIWQTTGMYLKVVDKFNEWFISAYITASGVRFMLLHDFTNVDGIRGFFTECHELYIKRLLNPFYEPNTPLQSVPFDTKVKALGRKYLT